MVCMLVGGGYIGGCDDCASSCVHVWNGVLYMVHARVWSYNNCYWSMYIGEYTRETTSAGVTNICHISILHPQHPTIYTVWKLKMVAAPPTATQTPVTMGAAVPSPPKHSPLPWQQEGAAMSRFPNSNWNDM